MSDVNSKMPGLIERRHSSEKGNSGRGNSIVVIGNNTFPVDKEQCIIDRSIYEDINSLRLAPNRACPCNLCKERRVIQSFERYIQDKDCLRLTPEWYSNVCITSDDHVELKYKTPEKRMFTFRNDDRCRDDRFSWALAKAGFYVTPEIYEKGDCVNLSCFRCAIRLRMLDKRCDPFREHARWFPTCAFVIHQKGMEFIHRVLQDTIEIQQEHDERRNSIQQISGVARRQDLD